MIYTIITAVLLLTLLPSAVAKFSHEYKAESRYWREKRDKKV